MYHLNSDGEPLACKATKGRCPYADDKHFSSKDEAREAFERLQENNVTSVSKSIQHAMTLSSETTDLLNMLYGEGLNPYVVGGSVRDSMMSGAIPKDIDIEVFEAENMDDLESLLKKSGYKVDSVGKSFGVLTMQLHNGESIDVALPRIDSKVGEGHRGFEVTVDPKLSMADAAGRRDYTINALYYSLRDGVVKDPYGGLEDYRKKQLRHINEHFSDDPLRVIRGAQFAARFKMQLSDETAELCKSLKNTFDSLPVSRFQTEFYKMFTGDVTYGLKALAQTGWDTNLKLSELKSGAGESANQSIARADEFSEDRTVFGAASLLKAAPNADRTYIAEYMVTKKSRQKKALALSKVGGPRSHNARDVKAWAREIGRSGLTAKDYYIISGDERARKSAVKYQSFDSPIADIITGEKILEYSKDKPGPWMGKLLREALQAQDEEVFTTDLAARQWLESKLKTL